MLESGKGEFGDTIGSVSGFEWIVCICSVILVVDRRGTTTVCNCFDFSIFKNLFHLSWERKAVFYQNKKNRTCLQPHHPSFAQICALVARFASSHPPAQTHRRTAQRQSSRILDRRQHPRHQPKSIDKVHKRVFEDTCPCSQYPNK